MNTSTASALSKTLPRILTFLFSLAILVLSLLPDPPGNFDSIRYGDKIAHTAAYCGLAFLVYLSFRGRATLSRFLLAFSFTLVFGGLIELAQHLFHRHPELWDFAADGLGSLIGTAIGAFLVRRIRVLSN